MSSPHSPVPAEGAGETTTPSAPYITIITATRNAASCLDNAARSIREQTFRSFEWIIVDGESSDDTLSVIRDNEDIVSWWVSEPDRGIYDAWNKGLRHATGEWICFLGADDRLWDPTTLQRIATVLAGLHAGTRLLYGRVAVTAPSEEVLEVVGKECKKIGKRMRGLMCIPHPAAMHHRSLFEQFGQFDDSFKIAGDYEFLLRVLNHTEARFLAGQPLVAMRHGGASSAQDNIRRQLLEVRRAQRLHGIRFPKASWVMAFGRAIIREALWRLLGVQRAKWILDAARRVAGKAPFWSRT